MQDDLSSPYPSASRKSLSFATPVERDAFWLAAIQEQATSGLSICAFCQSQGLPVSSFHHWKRTLAKRQAAAIRPEEKTKCSKKEGNQDASVLSTESPTSGKLPATVCFAEVRLTEAGESHHSSGIEIQHGSFLLRLQTDCDRTLLRDLLGMLGSQPC